MWVIEPAYARCRACGADFYRSWGTIGERPPREATGRRRPLDGGRHDDADMNESELKWLREYIDVRFAGSDKLRQEERLSDQRAVGIAKEEIDRRLADMNELRRQITEERLAYVPRGEHIALTERLRLMETWQARVTGALVLVGSLGIANFIRIWFVAP